MDLAEPLRVGTSVMNIRAQVRQLEENAIAFVFGTSLTRSNMSGIEIVGAVMAAIAVIRVLPEIPKVWRKAIGVSVPSEARWMDPS